MKSLTLVLAAFALGCSKPAPGTRGASTLATAGPPTSGGGGGMSRGMMGAATSATPMMGAAHSDTSAAPSTTATGGAKTAECPAVDQALVDRGRAVFSGAGNCFACHGASAKGTTLAPDLTDTTWINVDGSYAAIAGLVRTGVPKPKQHPAPMPPLGGATLNGAQVCAVSAYVYSLSHR